MNVELASSYTPNHKPHNNHMQNTRGDYLSTLHTTTQNDSQLNTPS